MITINFENREKTPLWEWIYLSIKHQIENEVLGADEKLPSKRSLSSHLGVSVITVQTAYQLLIDEGWIYSIEKKGFFVTDIKNNRIVSGAIKADVARTTKISIPKKNPEPDSKIIDLSSNSVSEENFPFSLWAHITRKILTGHSHEVLERTSVFGTSRLRSSLAKYLLDFKGISVNENQIVIGAGTESLYTMLAQLLGRDKIFAVENPGYPKVKKILELNGAKTIAIQTDGDGMNIETLSKTDADIIHISPNHHFPTGTVMGIKRRLELLDWSEKKSGRFIIEDDYDSEFRFNGKPLPPLQSSDTNGTVIYINTFSKILSPSFRISYMVLPEKLIAPFTEKLGIFSCPVPTLDQLILADFIDGRHLEKHISRMRNIYRNLRNSLIQALEKSSLSDKIKILEENSGLHFLLKITSEKSAPSIKSSLLDFGIKISLLDDFFLNDKFLSFDSLNETVLVVNYSALKKSDIPKLIEGLEKTILR
ncbi:MAG: PLP-dependent aminotransferase family protein [Treponema sp.]|nr:PLP-dependent aminotransferase family protein [Treponema sp.]